MSKALACDEDVTPTPRKAARARHYGASESHAWGDDIRPCGSPRRSASTRRQHALQALLSSKRDRQQQRSSLTASGNAAGGDQEGPMGEQPHGKRRIERPAPGACDPCRWSVVQGPPALLSRMRGAGLPRPEQPAQKRRRTRSAGCERQQQAPAPAPCGDLPCMRPGRDGGRRSGLDRTLAGSRSLHAAATCEASSPTHARRNGSLRSGSRRASAGWGGLQPFHERPSRVHTRLPGDGCGEGGTARPQSPPLPPPHELAEQHAEVGYTQSSRFGTRTKAGSAD